MRSRTLVAVGGIVVSLIVTAVLWRYFGQPVFLLVIPFIPFLFWRRNGDQPPTRRCPECGFRTRDPEFEHCPRDGTRLERN